MPKRKTQEEYKKEFEYQSKGEYLLLSPYRGAMNKIKVKHIKCGNVYVVTPTRFRQGTRCPKCAIKKRTKTTDDFKRELSILGNNEYKLLSDYINNHHKVKIKHLVCDTIYEVRPNDFISGRRCPYCGGGKLREGWLLKKLSKVNDKITLLDKYHDNKTPLKVKCNVCNNTWLTTTSNLLQGYGCPVCRESHGEKYIRNYLDKNNINYIPQKRFHDLKDKTYLSYDFYLPDYNTLIEYQGIQHYESVSFDNKIKTDLEKQQYHDKLKREYAKNNGYKLLELKYTLDNQELVDKYLSRRIKG